MKNLNIGFLMLSYDWWLSHGLACQACVKPHVLVKFRIEYPPTIPIFLIPRVGSR